jgi:hypothetical protein
MKSQVESKVPFRNYIHDPFAFGVHFSDAESLQQKASCYHHSEVANFSCRDYQSHASEVADSEFSTILIS